MFFNILCNFALSKFRLMLFRSLNRNFDYCLSYSRSEKSKILCFFAHLIVTLNFVLRYSHSEMFK